jgi:hypothetical protein
MARAQPDGVCHVDQDQNCCTRACRNCLRWQHGVHDDTGARQGFGLGWGIGAGLLGAAVVGSAIAASDGYYYDGYRRCSWVRQYDAYGNFMGRVRSCNY